MNSTRWYHTISIVIAIAILIAFLYAIRSILPPFLIAFAIAWILDPVLDRLQARGCPRILAISGVYLLFLAFFIVSVVLLVPAMIDQAKELGRDIPRYSERFVAFTTEFMEKHRSALTKFELPTTIQEVFGKYGHYATHQVTLGIERASKLIVANLSMALWFIIIPLVAFYFLNDIDRMREKAVLFIPERARPRVTEILSRIGTVFSSYVRGLIVVCLLYGLATTIVLAGFNLKYSIILGLLAGVLYAVPYLGAIVTTLLVFLVGLATYENAVVQAAWVAGAMIVLNQLFDMLITPRILGKSVGLHPVISLFALMAGGQLFGLVGMVLAVPVAASVQEVVLELYPELKAAPKKRPPRKRATRRKSKRVSQRPTDSI